MLTDSYKEIMALLVVAATDVEEANKAASAAVITYEAALERMARLRTAAESLAQLPEIQAVISDTKAV